jgi:hypothetical protein
MGGGVVMKRDPYKDMYKDIDPILRDVGWSKFDRFAAWWVVGSVLFVVGWTLAMVLSGH